MIFFDKFCEIYTKRSLKVYQKILEINSDKGAYKSLKRILVIRICKYRGIRKRQNECQKIRFLTFCKM